MPYAFVTAASVASRVPAAAPGEHRHEAQGEPGERDAGDQVDAGVELGEVAGTRPRVAAGRDEGGDRREDEGRADLAGTLHQPGGEPLLVVGDAVGRLGHDRAEPERE